MHHRQRVCEIALWSHQLAAQLPAVIFIPGSLVAGHGIDPRLRRIGSAGEHLKIFDEGIFHCVELRRRIFRLLCQGCRQISAGGRLLAARNQLRRPLRDNLTTLVGCPGT